MASWDPRRRKARMHTVKRLGASAATILSLGFIAVIVWF